MRLADDAQANRLRAVVMIETDPKQADRVSVELKKMPEVRSLAALSGSYDLVAMIETETPARIDALLDRIGRAPGVARDGVFDYPVGEVFAVGAAPQSALVIPARIARTASDPREGNPGGKSETVYPPGFPSPRSACFACTARRE